MDTAIVLALISLGGAIIGSGGITAIVNYVLSKKGKTAKQLDSIESEIGEVKNEVQNLENKVDKNEAQRARTQILRFSDEIYTQPDHKHSKEHFDEILAAINLYNEYCDSHPRFENDRTEAAQKRIKQIYNKCLKEHTFL